MVATWLDGYTQTEVDAARAQTARTWFAWLDAVYPEHVGDGFAPYHAEFWDWVWALTPDARPRPFVAIWPRGWGKSTSAELACAVTAARATRSYALYVSETQAQADDHVQNVAALLESDTLALLAPRVAERHVGKFGNVLGWRRNRLTTASGFTIDAAGLDTASRGLKMGAVRPDLLVIDDLDGKLDTAASTEKKLTTLTHSIIPTGGLSLTVLAVQNLVNSDGIFSRLADGRADFLADRIVSGPHPAVEGLTTEQRDDRVVITGGLPTWDALGLAACQAMIDAEGITAFLAERQHRVEALSGGMFDHVEFRHCRPEDVPDLTRVVVWVDPAVTDTDQSDAHGIQADGLAPNGDIYRLWSWEQRTSPDDVLRRAILKAVDLKAECVGVETDQGGDTWRSVYQAVWAQLVTDGMIPADMRRLVFREAKAGAGHGPKTHRAGQMLADYERGTIIHVVGTHEVLQRALLRFPRTKPFDLVDAAYWSWFSLRRPTSPRPRVLAPMTGGG